LPLKYERIEWARAGAEGRVLLFLMKNEGRFLEYLIATKLDSLITNLGNTNREILALGKEALRGYLMVCKSHPMNDCLNLAHLEIEGIPKSVQFDGLPYLNVLLSDGKGRDRGNDQKREEEETEGRRRT
jgi:hypothetical protein